MAGNAEILCRLDALAAEIRGLKAVVAGSVPAAAPVRVGQSQAAAMLGCSVKSVKRYAARGLLVRLPKPAGAARNAATYFDPANVAALAVSEDAAREWVARRKYVPHSRPKRSHG